MALSKDKFSLLTLNTHSWQEADNAFCLRHAAEGILKEKPDIIALQEINQKEKGALADSSRLSASGFTDGGSPIGEENWALCLAERLREGGRPYFWTWIFAHLGYKGWAEGLAVMSAAPIREVRWTDISNPAFPQAHVRRHTLAVRTDKGWFLSAHTGWWDDPEDPFAEQWNRLKAFCAPFTGPCYLMGDFNCPAQFRGEGYDRILSDHWEDCYARAEEKDRGITVPEQIDGWRNRKVDGLRLDLCLARQQGRTLRSRVIFNGDFHPRISDHFGVFTEEEL